MISDVHGNARALERAFTLMGDVDEIFALGDSINQYRFSNEVVGLLRERGACTIVGNHEEAFFGAGGQRARSLDWIDRDLMCWLGAQAPRRTLERCGKRLLLVHSTPWTPGGDYVVPENPAFARFGEVDADILLYGHTHQPVSTRVNGVQVVNPGSVGEPQTGAGSPRFNCVVLDVVSEEVRQISFALEEEAE